jgi:purine-nucleoside phosphorylase
MQPTAIISALAQEQSGLIALLHNPSQVTHAGRDFWRGELHGQAVVLALSKIGKVSATTTATALIERFGVQRMVFTGVSTAWPANMHRRLSSDYSRRYKVRSCSSIYLLVCRPKQFMEMAEIKLKNRS